MTNRRLRASAVCQHQTRNSCRQNAENGNGRIVRTSGNRSNSRRVRDVESADGRSNQERPKPHWEARFQGTLKQQRAKGETIGDSKEACGQAREHIASHGWRVTAACHELHILRASAPNHERERQENKTHFDCPANCVNLSLTCSPRTSRRTGYRLPESRVERSLRPTAPSVLTE